MRSVFLEREPGLPLGGWIKVGPGRPQGGLSSDSGETLRVQPGQGWVVDIQH